MSRKFWLKAIASLVPALFVFVGIFVGILAAQQTPPPPAKDQGVPPEAAQKANPVKPTAESIAKGKKVYNVDCSLCHGENGDGKSDMDMKDVPDLTNPDVQKNATDGQWFYIIRKGKGDMPPEGADRAKDEEVWNMVNYLRTLGKK